MNAPSFPVMTVAVPEAEHPVEISVVMPCLNESATIGKCVKDALDAIKRLNLTGEVVIGDNGSIDGSENIATSLGARVISVPERGYGAALRGAITAARGRYILMGDSDDSHDFAQLGLFLTKLREGYDLVVGNRFRGGILPGAMPLLHRYAGNPILSGIGRLLFKSPIGDFHCGLRAFRRDRIEQLYLQAPGMEFSSEMIVKATLYGLRLAEIPTTQSPAGRKGASHVRTWQDGWRHLRLLLLYSPRWLFLYPGIALSSVGTLASLWLLLAPNLPGRVTLDAVLFSVMATLLGFQSIHFGVITKTLPMTPEFRVPTPPLGRLLRSTSLEIGLGIGGSFFFLGAVIWAAELSVWGKSHFSSFNLARALLFAVPRFICLALGFQVMLSSFFLGVLRIETNTIIRG